MGLFDQNQDQSQTVRYSIDVDTSRVQAAIDQIQRAAEIASGSVMGLSSNTLGNIAGAYASGIGAGVMPGVAPVAPGLMAGAMAPQLAAMYAANPMSPVGQMARDALNMQYQAMGGGTTMTSPFGGALYSFSGQPGAAYRAPYGAIAAGPYGFADARNSRVAMGSGSGSFMDVASMSVNAGVFGLSANPNLEDRMLRMYERRLEGFAENVTSMGRWGAATGLGGALGGMAAYAYTRDPFAAAGGAAMGMGLLQGVNRAIDHFAQPISSAARDMRAYTAPYVQEGRVGGGMSYRDMLQTQRDMARVMTSDKWFTSQEMSEVVKIAGETGIMSFMGSKDQAIKAVEKLGETVKTLYALGVKSREQLSTISASLSQFGLNPTNTQQMANFFAGASIQARSAGMTVGELTQAATPYSAMGMAQGLGAQSGARMYMQNRGRVGAIKRGGRWDAMDEAYYGGEEGAADILTQGYMQTMRTPFGQAFMMGILGDQQNREAIASGQGLSYQQIMAGNNRVMGRGSMYYEGMRAQMPRMMQMIPGEMLQNGMTQSMMNLYRQQFGGGPIDQENFNAFLMHGMGMDSRTATLMTKVATEGGSAYRIEARNARDKMIETQLESQRGPDLGRIIDKGILDPVRRRAAEVQADFKEFGARAAESLEEQITGVKKYDYGAWGKEMQRAGGGSRGLVEGTRQLRELGFDSTLASPGGADMHGAAVQRLTSDLASGNKDAIEQLRAAAQAKGMTDEQVNNYLTLAKGGSVRVRLDEAARKDVEGALMRSTGAKDITAAAAAIAQGGRGAFDSELRRMGYSSAYGDAYLDPSKEINITQDQASAATKRGIASVFDAAASARLRQGGDFAVGAQRDRAAPISDAGGRQAMIDSLRGRDDVLQGRSAEDVVDTYLKRSTQDSEGGYNLPDIDLFGGRVKIPTSQIPFNLPGQGPRDRAFGDGQRGNRVALSTADTEALNQLAEEKVIKPHAKFQQDHLPFLAAVNATPDTANPLLQRQAQDTVAGIMTDRGRREQLLAAMGEKDNQARFSALAAVAMPGLDAANLTQGQQAQLGYIAREASTRMGRDQGMGTAAQRNGALELMNAGRVIEDANSIGLDEFNRRREEATKTMDAPLRDLLRGADVARTKKVSEIIRMDSLAKMMAGAKSSKQFLADVASEGGLDRSGLATLGVTDEMLASIDSGKAGVAADNYRAWMADPKGGGGLYGLTSEEQRSIAEVTSGTSGDNRWDIQKKVEQTAFGREHMGWFTGSAPTDPQRSAERARSMLKQLRSVDTLVQDAAKVNLGLTKDDLSFSLATIYGAEADKKMKEEYQPLLDDVSGPQLSSEGLINLTMKMYKDDKNGAMGDRGRVKQYMDMVRNIGSKGSDVTAADYQQLVQFTGASEEEARKIGADMYSQAGDKQQGAMSLARSVLRETILPGGALQQATAANVGQGGVGLSPEVQQAIKQAFDKNMQLAENADKIARQFADSKMGDTMKQMAATFGTEESRPGAGDGSGLAGVIVSVQGGKALRVTSADPDPSQYQPPAENPKTQPSPAPGAPGGTTLKPNQPPAPKPPDKPPAPRPAPAAPRPKPGGGR